MSTLNVSNITDGTDTVGTSYVLSGSAKAWIKFNAIGTVAINDSNNISSVTDNGTGDFSLNFSSNMESGSYSMTGNCGHDAPSNAPSSVRFAATFTSAVCRFNQLYASGSTNGKGDYEQGCNTIHGDLA